MYSDYVLLVDKKSSGTDGGGILSGDWRTRNLTDEIEDTGNICSLAANQFTLQAGTYRCLISCPGFRLERHQSRLYNITDAALELLGTSAWNEDSPNAMAQTRAFVVGKFTIADSKVFEVQHRAFSSRAADGLGIANSWGDQIYTVVELWTESSDVEVYGPRIQVI